MKPITVVSTACVWWCSCMYGASRHEYNREHIE